MAEPFKTRTEVRAWLETQPRDVITVFAARAALRSLPRLIAVSPNGKSQLSEISVSCFWALSVSLSAGHWATKSTDLLRSATSAATNADDAADAADVSYSATFDAAADAAYAAANTVAYTTYANANAADAASFTDIAAAVANASGGGFSQDGSIDRNFIETGKSARDLAKAPLWWDQTSVNYESLTKDWAELKTYLLANDKNWWVWTDWYDDRLRGNAVQPFKLPFVEEVEIGGDFENGEYGRCTLPEEYYKDPAKANAAIAEVIESYWAEQQDITVETFGPNSDGIIDRTTAQTSPGLTDTPEQRDWYDSLRDAALGMQDIGENALGRAARPVNNLIKAMPENMAEAKLAKLWPAANRIRKLKAAHDRAAAGPEDYHPNLLASEVIDDVDQFVEVYNNFTVGDAGLSEKDRNTAGPQDPDTEIKASEAATHAINVAREHGLFTEEADEVLTETIAENQEIIAELKETNSLSVLEKLALDNTRREKENAIRAIILRVRDSEEYGAIKAGALKAIGTAIIAAVSYGGLHLLGLASKLF